jgi:hypothetical protein
MDGYGRSSISRLIPISTCYATLAERLVKWFVVAWCGVQVDRSWQHGSACSVTTANQSAVFWRQVVSVFRPRRRTKQTPGKVLFRLYCIVRLCDVWRVLLENGDDVIQTPWFGYM